MIRDDRLDRQVRLAPIESRADRKYAENPENASDRIAD
jgi:hypothetical protein